MAKNAVLHCEPRIKRVRALPRGKTLTPKIDVKYYYFLPPPKTTPTLIVYWLLAFSCAVRASETRR